MVQKEIVKSFRSVKIAHDIIHRIDYAYLAEFFRFMGILVCEDILVEASDDDAERTEAELNTKYNAYIYIGERTLAEDEINALGTSEDKYKEQVQMLPAGTIFLYDDLSEFRWADYVREMGSDIFSRKLISRLPQDVQKYFMYEFLTKVLETAGADSEQACALARQLKELVDIYVEQALWLHSMNLQFYRKRKSDQVAFAKQAFLQSHNEIKELLDQKSELPVSPWYQYAWLWCEWKVDTACDYVGDILYFSVDKLAGRCKRLHMEYPWFNNVNVLLGLSYEPAKNRINEALFAFKEALKDMKDECFAAPVYYWMGRRYETYPDMKDRMEFHYNLAAKSKQKFRTTFKLAVIARDKQEYEKAIFLFDKLIKRLELKLAMRFTDPLELEYLFKAYVQQCYIYNRRGENLKVAETAKKAKEIYNKSIDESHYFEVFYGENADKYRDLLRGRMDLKTIEWLEDDSRKRYGQRAEEVYV